MSQELDLATGSKIALIICHLPSLCPLLEDLHLPSIAHSLPEALVETLPHLQHLKSFGSQELAYITLCQLSSLPQLQHLVFLGMSGDTDIATVVNSKGFPALESLVCHASPTFHAARDLIGWISSSSLKTLFAWTWANESSKSDLLHFGTAIRSQLATSLQVLCIGQLHLYCCHVLDPIILEPLLQCHRLVNVTLALN
jgi:hypothetical protein